VARFLIYAVVECGTPTRFKSPSKAKRNELIGSSDTTIVAKLSPPVKPEDIAALLDQMAADGEHELKPAVGLVGLYELMPSELAVLTIKDGKGYVGSVKRNSRTMSAKAQQARPIRGLDIAEREG
jgi:hypothetical protein